MAADLTGVDTHGSQRLEMYRKHIAAGFVQIGAKAPRLKLRKGIILCKNRFYY